MIDQLRLGPEAQRAAVSSIVIACGYDDGEGDGGGMALIRQADGRTGVVCVYEAEAR